MNTTMPTDIINKTKTDIEDAWIYFKMLKAKDESKYYGLDKNPYQHIHLYCNMQSKILIGRHIDVRKIMVQWVDKVSKQLDISSTTTMGALSIMDQYMEKNIGKL